MYICSWTNPLYYHILSKLSAPSSNDQILAGSSALQITSNYFRILKSIPGQNYSLQILLVPAWTASQINWILYPLRINVGHITKKWTGRQPQPQIIMHICENSLMKHMSETILAHYVHLVWAPSTHCQTFSSPVPSPLKNKPPGPDCIALISCLENILPLSLNL